MATRMLRRELVGPPRNDRKADVLARRFARWSGIAFLIIGVLGFIPGITTNVDELDTWKWHSGAELFGVFQTSILHNVVHLAFGVLGILAARRTNTARWFLIGGGIIYLALWVYGLVIDKHSDANFVPVDHADDWLHFALGLGLLALGLMTLRPSQRARMRL